MEGRRAGNQSGDNRNNRKFKKNNRNRVNKIGSTYLDKESIDITWYTTYAAVAGTAVSQGINVNTSLVSTSYANFAILISNLWSEYRCTRITLKFTWTFNTANSGLYIPTCYMAQFRGDTAPAITLAGLTSIPWTRISSPPQGTTITWVASKDDPEAWIFRQTAAALPITGGVVSFIGAAAPTSNVSYCVIKVKACLDVRGRKV